MLTARGKLPKAELAARDAHEFGEAIAAGWGYLDYLVLGRIAYYRGRLEDALDWIRRGIDVEPVSYQSGLLSGALFWTLEAARPICPFPAAPCPLALVGV